VDNPAFSNIVDRDAMDVISRGQDLAGIASEIPG
jgi:hypothetical protein